MAESAPTTSNPSTTSSPEANTPVPATHGEGGGVPQGSTAAPPKGGLSKQLGSAPAEGASTEAEAPEAPKPPSKRKYKLKVDGQEFEEELSDDDIAVRLQKEKAWNKRQNELAAERKKLEEFYSRGKKDPFAVMKEMFGVDGLTLAQQKLAEQYQLELKRQEMSPEERVREEYEAKLAEERAQREEIQRQIQEKEQAALEEQVFKDTESRFIAALEHEGLPKTYEALAEMAKVAKMAHEHGYELSDAQLAEEVRNRLEAHTDKLHKSVLSGLTGEALLKRFPEPVVKEIVKAVLARSKAAVTPPPSAPVKRAPVPKPRQEEAELTPGQRRKQRLGLL